LFLAFGQMEGSFTVMVAQRSLCEPTAQQRTVISSVTVADRKLIRELRIIPN
jgi:hypothetical protein